MVRDTSKRHGAGSGRTSEAYSFVVTGALDNLFKGGDWFSQLCNSCNAGGRLLPQGDSDCRPRRTTFAVTFNNRFKSGY